LENSGLLTVVLYTHIPCNPPPVVRPDEHFDLHLMLVQSSLFANLQKRASTSSESLIMFVRSRACRWLALFASQSPAEIKGAMGSLQGV
jgi:hypothetical protein